MSKALSSVFALRSIYCVLRNFVYSHHRSFVPRTSRLLSLPMYANVRLLSINASVICWKCGQENKKLFFCSHCNALQKPKTTYNFFSLFGVPNMYDIDVVTVAKKFRELQTELHPDKFSNACEEEKSYSADLSATVNRAYRTLIDPLERGLYMLKLNGEQIPEDSNSTDKAFLFQIMELNEELEDLGTKENISRFGIQNKEALSKLVMEVTAAFEEQNFNAAKEALIRMKYFSTLQNKIKSKLLDIDIKSCE